MSTRTLPLAVLAVVFLASSALAGPGIPNDHLLCFTINDPAPKARYTAMVSDEGNTAVSCIVKVPAKQLCTGTTKQNVSPAPPDPNVVGASLGLFLCYSAKCDVKAGGSVAIGDQFGSRPGTLKAPKTLCTPANAGA